MWLQVIAFWGGPIALHGLVHFLNTTGHSLTKVVYAYFDRISYFHTYIYREIYMCIYIYNGLPNGI